ncbi:MAG: GNAT family N-acetyltransferase [Planctomycetota bacterium]|jgi:acyl-CoA hydrolase/RimJ/RimL family protein N-acetyltransferase
MAEANPGCDKNWQSKYKAVVASAKDAVKQIRPGQRIFIGTGCAQPQALVEALLGRAQELHDVEIVQLLTLADAPYTHRELAKHFRLDSFFIAGSVPESLQTRLGEYTPIFLSHIPRLFNSGRLPLDVALIQVTPPNERGMCSLMPWTMGDSLLYVHDIDTLVPADMPILESKLPEPTEISCRIAEYTAALIEDGSTLSLGVESIPLALPGLLKDKHDLGIHTEVLADPIIDLVESGVITGARKSVDTGRIVACMCMGTRRLYDYVDNNPIFSFRPAEYVSAPHLISQQHKMVTVNVALEVDLTGQVCANSFATKSFSGMSNQMDFTHGAAESPEGKSVVVLESTGDNGNVSRIMPHLSPGAAVAANSREVDYVVTECGVAYLHGKTLQERVLALISIAHPDFRAHLLEEAIRNGYVSSELAAVEGKILVGPPGLRTSCVLDDGTQIGFRPMHPTDERRMRGLFYSLSPESVYYRFMSHLTRIPQKEAQNFLYTDYRNDMAIVGTLLEAHGEDIVAIGRYYLDPRTNRAELAFIVRDQWQNRGIGTFLLRYLITIAKRNGIAGFTAEVLPQNKSMLAVLNKSGCKTRSHLDDDVCIVELDFE